MATQDPQVPSEPDAGVPATAAVARSSASPEKVHREKKRRLGVDPQLILSTEGRSKRRRTPSPPPDTKQQVEHDPKDPERAAKVGLQIYTKILGMHDTDGESMSEPFLVLPNKREFPDYYETIKHPMSLEMVHKKLEKKEYNTLKEVCADLGQIWNNAKRYNMRESLLFQWAKRLHKITRTFYNKHIQQDDDSDSEAEDDHRAHSTPARSVAALSRGVTADYEDSNNATAGPSTPAGSDGGLTSRGPGTGRKRGSYMKDGPTVYKLIKPCMRAIREARSEDGRNREIAGIFQTLPDRRDFPDYYRVVKYPISLSEIENKMVSRKYDTSDEFFADLERMCDNAMIYNEDESEVWRDARQIRSLAAAQRDMVQERLRQPSAKAPVAKAKSHAMTPARYGMPSPPVPYGGHVQQPPGMHFADPRSPWAGQQPHHITPPGAHAHLHTPLPLHAQHAQPQHYVPQYSTPPVASPAPAPSTPFLPQLPQGVVTEQVVASLGQYPAHEQQAWINSLPPLALSIYRQMIAANEARKRGAPPPVTEPAQPPPPPEPVVTIPAIQFFDFAFSDTATVPTPLPSAVGTPAILSPAPEVPASQPLRSAIRLYNLPGVRAHAVAIPGKTVELELTAWVKPSDKTAGRLPEISLRVNGTNVPSSNVINTGTDNPAGVRWTVPVSKTRTDYKLEFVVIAAKSGSAPETSAIIVNRQY